jgi:hypothetical protein
LELPVLSKTDFGDEAIQHHLFIGCKAAEIVVKLSCF